MLPTCTHAEPFRKPCGKPARGTVEIVPGVALISDSEKGAVYAGETAVDWDRQVPLDGPGLLLECEDGHRFPAPDGFTIGGEEIYPALAESNVPQLRDPTAWEKKNVAAMMPPELRAAHAQALKLVAVVAEFHLGQTGIVQVHEAAEKLRAGQANALCGKCGKQFHAGEPEKLQHGRPDGGTCPTCSTMEAQLEANLKPGIEGSGLEGEVVIFGQRHYVYAIRVRTGRDGQQVGVGDTLRRFHDLGAYLDGVDGALQTVKLPGRKGEWLLSITPVSA